MQLSPVFGDLSAIPAPWLAFSYFKQSGFPVLPFTDCFDCTGTMKAEYSTLANHNIRPPNVYHFEIHYPINNQTIYNHNFL